MNIKNFISSNNIPMLRLLGSKYNWELKKEHDNSVVLSLTLGDSIEDFITCLYVENTLSIRKFNTTYGGNGDTFFFELPFDEVDRIIDALVTGHRLGLMPLFDGSLEEIK